VHPQASNFAQFAWFWILLSSIRNALQYAISRLNKNSKFWGRVSAPSIYSTPLAPQSWKFNYAYDCSSPERKSCMPLHEYHLCKTSARLYCWLHSIVYRCLRDRLVHCGSLPGNDSTKANRNSPIKHEGTQYNAIYGVCFRTECMYVPQREAGLWSPIRFRLIT